jgi:hypothetical protein
MLAPENKHMLWDLTNHLYRKWMPRDRVVKLFELTLKECADSPAPLLEQNKTFLKIYSEKIALMEPETAEERERMFEERVQLKQKGTDPPLVLKPEKKTDEARILEELADIKKMLHFIMERVQSRL